MSSELSLDQLKDGQTATVIGLNGGHEFQNRITSMGVIPGCDITVLKNGGTSNGPILAAVGDTRIVIDRQMIQKIVVEP